MAQNFVHHPAVYSTHPKVQIYAATPKVSASALCYINII
jgi:hypothetical protein